MIGLNSDITAIRKDTIQPIRTGQVSWFGFLQCLAIRSRPVWPSSYPRVFLNFLRSKDPGQFVQNSMISANWIEVVNDAEFSTYTREAPNIPFHYKLATFGYIC